MADDRNPHIILITTDQQRWDSTGASGSSWMHTPNLDRLANDGINFRNCFCASPSCVPSRASFFTCRYPHENGVFHNGDAWTPTWVEQLRAAGYHTANVGKMHTVPLAQPAGFDHRFIVENKDRPHRARAPHRRFFDEWDKFLLNCGIEKPNREAYRARHPDYETALGAYIWPEEEQYHSDAFVANMAEWFIDARGAAESPLFLEIGFPGPHPPYDPPERWAKLYEDVDVPIPTVSDHEYAKQPPPHARYRQEMIEGNHDAVRWNEHPTPEQLRRLRRFYAGNVSLIDACIGRILAALERGGYLENAVVLFTSDHGEALGDHGHIQKWTMYDEVTRVPIYLWSPSHVRRAAAVDDLVQHMDLVPMLFEMAGVPFETPPKCASAAPLLRGEPGEREYIYAEHGRCSMLPEIERVRMIRNHEWKLVDYPGETFGELYDLENDPGEHVNLWDEAPHAGTRRSLSAALEAWAGA